MASHEKLVSTERPRLQRYQDNYLFRRGRLIYQRDYVTMLLLRDDIFVFLSLVFFRRTSRVAMIE